MFTRTKNTENSDSHNDKSNADLLSFAGTGRNSGKNSRSAPSIISADLVVFGNLVTLGDMQIEGTVEGNIRSHLLTIGQSATIRGEIIADDVVIHGRVIGCIRGLKIRLTSTAQVEGDIIHKTIAIESGADFHGLVQRLENPLVDPDEDSSLFSGPVLIEGSKRLSGKNC